VRHSTISNMTSRYWEAPRHTEQIQEQLWLQAIALAEKDARSLPASLFIQSLNDTIDLSAKRQNALENHVPPAILWMLTGVGLLAMAATGYGAAFGNRRHVVLTTLLALLVAAVILLIVDLDRPQRGLIKVSEQNMINLRDSLEKNQP